MILNNNMRDRPKRNVDLEHCNCCITTCLPCIWIWLCLEYTLKGLCCCPCYIDIYCCDKKKVKPRPVLIVLPDEIPIDENTLTSIDENTISTEET